MFEILSSKKHETYEIIKLNYRHSLKINDAHKESIGLYIDIDTSRHFLIILKNEFNEFVVSCNNR